MSQQINLFNPIFLNPRKLFSLVTMLQALGLIVLGSGLFYGYAWYQVKSLNTQIDETGKRYLTEQAKLLRFADGGSPQESAQSLESDFKSVEARLATQQQFIETLKSGVIGNAAGYSEYMRAFARQAVNGVWLTSFNISGNGTQMSISGAVLSPELLPVYISKLNQEQVMRGKPFASLQMRRGGDGGRSVEFTLQSSETGGAAK